LAGDLRRHYAARRVLGLVELAMNLQERLDLWRGKRQVVEENLADAGPWSWPVYLTDILLIEGFIAYYETRLSQERNRRH
jgi:hypothetical protein